MTRKLSITQRRKRLTLAECIKGYTRAFRYAFTVLPFRPMNNLQRFQASLVILFSTALLYTPLPAIAQNLGNGAGQLNNSQCQQQFWFMGQMNTLILRVFSGLGNTSDLLCRILNVFIILSVFAVIGMVLWGAGQHTHGGVPLQKAFSGFTGYLLAIFIVWGIIGLTLLGSAIGNTAANPGIGGNTVPN